MKREIIFRGIKCNGYPDWLYGDLLHRDGRVYILPVDAPDSIDNYEVYPNSVGQFIGKKDKNGKMIFDKDIIGYPSANTGSIIYHLVEWNEKSASFKVRLILDDGTKSTIISSIDQVWLDEYEKVVIGNVFDNPDLVKDYE